MIFYFKQKKQPHNFGITRLLIKFATVENSYYESKSTKSLSFKQAESTKKFIKTIEKSVKTEQ